MAMLIKIINGNDIRYVNDILHVDVESDTKTVKVVETTGDVISTVTYSDENNFKYLKSRLDSCAMNGVPVELYEVESELTEFLDEQLSKVRKPGENPSL